MLTPLSFLAVLGLSATMFAQSTWHVDAGATAPGAGTQSAPYTSIQYAIAQPTTLPGDTVSVAPGVYAERLDYLGKDLRVRASAGAEQTTLDAQGLGAAVVFVTGEGPGAMLEGFRIRNGAGANALGTHVGGGVYCSDASPSLVDCVIEHCSATLGGGFAAVGGAPTLVRCRIRDNTAFADLSTSLDGEGGGVFLRDSRTARIWDSYVTNNHCTGCGAGILTENTVLELTGVDVRWNENSGALFSLGREWGGGLCARGGGEVRAKVSSFARNTILGALDPRGGGVGAQSPVKLENCTIEYNAAGTSLARGSGGGLAGAVSATSCTIYRNTAENRGGGAFGGVYDECWIEVNNSSQGGGVYGAQLEDTVLCCNFGLGGDSLERGGGAHSSVLLRCRVLSNGVHGEGGGAYNCDVTECSIESNGAYEWSSALGPVGGRGGGVYGGAVRDSLLWGNRVEMYSSWQGPPPAGAGAHSAVLERCTLEWNDATFGSWDSRGGGAAHCSLTQCVLDFNWSGLGAGIFGGSAERCTFKDNETTNAWPHEQASGATLASCIFDSWLFTTTVNNCSVSYSMFQAGVTVPGLGNLSGDPRFWNSAWWGDDLRLRPDSPCIDAGDPAAPLDPDGTRADMGALPFEASYHPLPISYCEAKTNSLGCTPKIFSTGTASLTGPDDFTLRAREVIGARGGVLLWSRDWDYRPFLGGYVCVRRPAIMSTAQISSGSNNACDGEYAYVFRQAEMAQYGLVAGDQVYAQWWTRDPGASWRSGFTDALQFTLRP